MLHRVVLAIILRIMIRVTEIKLPLDHSDDELRQALLAKLGITSSELCNYTIFKRAYDARKRHAILLVYSLDVATNSDAAILKRLQADPHVKPRPDMEYKFVAQAPGNHYQRPVVIGFGPCGLFAGLLLAQMGLRPIILERGKAVRERTVDTFAFWRKRELNTESNVQFGEGGAGTFSDGKLYSQVKDPQHHGRKVLEEFVKAGAPAEILYVSKPHIGTFKLVSMIENMRANIEALGGEIRFQQRVEKFQISTNSSGERQLRGLVLASGEEIESEHVVLAIGHSARDTFHTLVEQDIYCEPKPFSIGFRIEHPQSLIDQCRFGKFAGHPVLGAADYKLVHHASNQRSVYSFCMCPGGTVVAAASEAGRVVTNGMSQYSRNERNANSAIVVGITPEDFPCVEKADTSPLAGVALQRHWEEQAFIAGGSNYNAPAQLVGDFIRNQPSAQIGHVEPSYKPDISLGDLSSCLPGYAIDAIREALPAFDKQIKGFAMHDALLTGVETRTSSPIRIKRNDDFESINTRGLYPAGEGAGYAGGILSAGIDGIKVAEAVALAIMSKQN
jgi:uncharacterized FAD-dependent dehydrogenase